MAAVSMIHETAFGLVWVQTIGREACATLLAGISLEQDVVRKPLTLFGIMFWSAWEQVRP
ncbi:hypothetical protein BAE36_17970 [Rhizobium leguminosarum bv. trifolii]|jgi:hypothetical protein|nr:hypothetical protein BAE36_17970 [Rhizobium leguminosarum bv. trifolii]